ncbi:MAG: HU family DNA-binding protein [Nanoarchaeota archaeon]|jgi:DNA-binding protein HU-beta|nr:HU family DNA-binding protein [Nanoarchaeota archaeon]
MNKAQLIEAIAKEADLSKIQAGKALEAFMKAASKSKKEPVQLVGFGTFKYIKRKARKGVNPSTGEKIKIPAKTVFQFKASKNPKY